jgi:hypothetical protein
VVGVSAVSVAAASAAAARDVASDRTTGDGR